MKRTLKCMELFLSMLLILSGCGGIGQKTTSMSTIYAATAILSLLLLIGQFLIIKEKDRWFIMLFSSVFVVNCGYFTLSVCTTLEAALWANRIAYLGSVFLPLSMMMILMNITKLTYEKWVSWTLLGISILVFLIAASPGYLPIYYKEVSLLLVDGIAVLDKTYGPLHSVYLVYLLGYFSTMIAVLVHAQVQKKLPSVTHAVFLVVATFVNICVWLLEQLVHIEFEFLSVSYIISELFLLSIDMMQQEVQREKDTIPPTPTPAPLSTPAPSYDKESLHYFSQQLPTLTPTERTVYDLYLSGSSSKEILSTLQISENTLKFHNKNIYSKLGISSRKQLKELGKILERQHN